ncbi:MAG: YdbH domain-containing protein [Alphaproteobacteria bacterium]
MNDFQFMPDPQKDDLLSQISSQDMAEAAAAQKKKSQHSILIRGVVLVMKMTFMLDEVKRKHKGLFNVLGWIWALFMILVYIGGACMLCLLIYSYVRFPQMVRQSLIAQNILVKDYNINDFSFSKIELKDLEDKNGTYSIKKMTIHSTFSDFIRRRVKSVLLDGVRLKIKEGKDGINLGTLPEVLVSLNQRPIAHQVQVDNLSLTNAVVEIDGQDFKLPISFSLTGIYEKNSKITIPLSIKEEYVKIAGTLDITGNARQMDFVLQITSGTLTLPQHSPENITGEIRVTTRAMKMERISGNINLVYGKNTKRFNISAEKDQGNTLKGTVTLAFVNSDSYDPQKELKSNVSLNFEGMNFTSLYRFGTEKPLKVTIASFQKQGIDISNMNATLNGKLSCDDFRCVYRIMQSSPVFVRQSSVLFNSDMIKSSGEYSFSLAPNNQDTLVLRQNAFDYDAVIERLSFAGYRNAPSAPLSVKAGKMLVKGRYDASKNVRETSLDAQNMTITTPEIAASDATYQSDNVYNDNAKIQLTAKKIALKDNDVVKAPFSLSLEKQGLNTNARVGMEDNAVQIAFSGVSRLLTGEFRGDIYLHDVDLEKIKTPLNQISSLFPDGLRDVSGHLAAIGKIYWKNTKQISGPLFVSLKDVGFTYENVRAAGLNTVLSLQTLEPLVTANNQHLFISSINSKTTVQNFKAKFKLDNQFLKIVSADFVMAGIPLRADTALISLKSNNGTVTFKNNNVDFAAMNEYLKLPGVKVSGKGSVSLPLEMKNGTLFIKDGEIKISEGVLDLTQNNNDKLKTYFNKAGSFAIRTGSLYVDMDPAKDTATLTVSLDGRLMPGGTLKSVRQVINEKLEAILTEMPASAVPQDIVEKQKIVNR